MIGGYLFLPGAYLAALPFRPGNHPVHRFFKFTHTDGFLITPGGLDSGLIDQIGQVGAAQAHRALGQNFQVNVFIQRLAIGMDFQNGHPTVNIRAVQNHPAVKTTGPQKRRVENIRSVGGRHNDDAGAGIKTVHLHQYLVESLLSLIMAAAQTRTALTAHRINLINEDNAGSIALRLVKEVAHPRGTDAHKHLHEFAAAYREERHISLTGYRACHQGFSCARRSDQQDTFGNARAQRLELLPRFEEINHLQQFLLGLFHTGHIVKGHRGPIGRDESGAAATETHRLIICPSCLTEEEEQQTTEDDKRQEVEHQASPVDAR